MDWPLNQVARLQETTIQALDVKAFEEPSFLDWYDMICIVHRFLLTHTATGGSIHTSVVSTKLVDAVLDDLQSLDTSDRNPLSIPGFGNDSYSSASQKYRDLG